MENDYNLGDLNGGNKSQLAKDLESISEDSRNYVNECKDSAVNVVDQLAYSAESLGVDLDLFMVVAIISLSMLKAGKSHEELRLHTRLILLGWVLNTILGEKGNNQ